MRRAFASWLVRLYPRAWRDRFGPELEDLLEAAQPSLTTLIDVARAAGFEQMSNVLKPRSDEMQTYPASVVSMVRKPSAFIPIAMSFCAAAVVLVAVVIFGAAREPDEGAAAHIFQLLIAGQVPILALFTIKWLRRDHRAGFSILALQMLAMGFALAPVWILRL